MLVCPKCEGVDTFIKKGKINGVQKYKCVNVLEDGHICGSRTQPIYVEDGQESELNDILRANKLLAKSKQKYMDTNRIERKSFRESARMENALIEYIQELKTVIEENPLSIDTKKLTRPVRNSPSVGIVHLSDLHLNELVDIVGNKYDFKVASRRLKLFATKLIASFSARDISKVYVVFTGDLLNSDRRLDELLSMAVNRAQATFLSVQLLSQFVLELATEFKVGVISVTGNESRIREEYTQIDALATDNFDFMIYEMMKLYIGAKSAQLPNIEFISGNTFEYILSANNMNILIVHGHRLGKMGHTDISKAIAKWTKKGIIVDVIMCGHLHETFITDTVLRTGSLVGNNAYADVGLNLHSRASQNYYIIDEHGSMEATKVDLQSVDDDSPMYDITEGLEAYNSKSIDKIKTTTNILKIVI